MIGRCISKESLLDRMILTKSWIAVSIRYEKREENMWKQSKNRTDSTKKSYLISSIPILYKIRDIDRILCDSKTKCYKEPDKKIVFYRTMVWIVLCNENNSDEFRYLLDDRREENNPNNLKNRVIREELPDEISIDILELPKRILPRYREVEEIEIDSEISPDTIDKCLEKEEYSHPYKKCPRKHMDISSRSLPYDKVEEDKEGEDVEGGGKHS